jgi:ribosomal-protein-alanine N-acetyltransferase
MPQPKANSRPITNRISIRAAKIEDVAEILRIENAAPNAAHWNWDHYEKRIQSQPQGACFLIAESWDKKNICAFLCARIAAGEWEIENVVVDETLRRQSIGTQLMQSLIGRWEALLGAALLLEVRASNAAARALYERHGLREVGCRRAYYRSPPEDAILYVRSRSE